MHGTLYCVCISRIKDLPDIDLKFFAVRVKKFLPDGWEYIDSLAPSKRLFSDTQNLKKEGSWNEESFQKFYKPRFRDEITNNPQAKSDLKRMVLELKSGKDVAFACYCGNHQICHRGIIGEIFENVGFQVIYI
ncbi:DUF488 family protein, N3 subclade [Bacillus cereus group sp. TH152-1LC]|uniref:DUF488 family protein, N3 subclade n=1 Tax=Bacillus cereus group sp. TH152-1LC TaxID=3018060 RepID=UPI0022E978BF|nr:DUF488 family protein [Bacillus cereus group sp. TH152-1LC]MDA1674974.1 DUF488 family protein [Bacillus cereus group sp. TH152-1LC]